MTEGTDMTTWAIIGILAVGAGIMLVGVVVGAVLVLSERRNVGERSEP